MMKDGLNVSCQIQFYQDLIVFGRRFLDFPELKDVWSAEFCCYDCFHFLNLSRENRVIRYLIVDIRAALIPAGKQRLLLCVFGWLAACG